MNNFWASSVFWTLSYDPIKKIVVLKLVRRPQTSLVGTLTKPQNKLNRVDMLKKLDTQHPLATDMRKNLQRF